MYEYKVVEAKNAADAQKIMDKYSAEGWRVISNTYWLNFKAELIIAFEREKKA